MPFVKDYDVVFLHEVDTNCDSWDLLRELMGDEYRLALPEDLTKEELSQHPYYSISCAFVKYGIEYKCEKSIPDYFRNVGIKIYSTSLSIISVHTNDKNEYWQKLIDRWKQFKDGDALLIGDLNVFDENSTHLKDYNELLSQGAFDIWLNQGEDNNTPTYRAGTRIDYALASKSLLEKKPTEKIANSLLRDRITDHAAICVTINDCQKKEEDL